MVKKIIKYKSSSDIEKMRRFCIVGFVNRYPRIFLLFYLNKFEKYLSYE